MGREAPGTVTHAGVVADHMLTFTTRTLLSSLNQILCQRSSQRKMASSRRRKEILFSGRLHLCLVVRASSVLCRFNHNYLVTGGADTVRSMF